MITLSKKRKRITILIISMISLFAIWTNTAFAWSYKFSFITSGNQVGAYATKTGGKSITTVTVDSSSNVNASRYINTYVGSSVGGARISGYMVLNSAGAGRSAVYTNQGINYGGIVYLNGTPSSIGAAATGQWAPD